MNTVLIYCHEGFIDLLIWIGGKEEGVMLEERHKQKKEGDVAKGKTVDIQAYYFPN